MVDIIRMNEIIAVLIAVIFLVGIIGFLLYRRRHSRNQIT